MGTDLDISIVIPMFNESGNIGPLISQITDVMANQDLEYEVLLIDDGSHDQTWLQVLEVARNIKEVQGIKLSRNFGHQHALLAGLNKAQGKAVISMDADLQHPPAVLPELISHWQAGSKIVYTKRCSIQSLSAFKRKTSSWFYSVFSWLSGVTISEGSSDFRLIDQQVLKELIKFNDIDPFLRGAVRWLGFDEVSSTVEFDLGERLCGESEYTLARMMKFANSAIISFSTKPLIVGIWIGLITSLLAFTELAYIVVQFFMGNTVAGWASTVGIMALLFGILFVLLGILGIYLARIHTTLQGRPRFVIETFTANGHKSKGEKA